MLTKNAKLKNLTLKILTPKILTPRILKYLSSARQRRRRGTAMAWSMTGVRAAAWDGVDGSAGRRGRCRTTWDDVGGGAGQRRPECGRRRGTAMAPRFRQSLLWQLTFIFSGSRMDKGRDGASFYTPGPLVPVGNMNRD
jgi:hypothetical protein